MSYTKLLLFALAMLTAVTAAQALPTVDVTFGTINLERGQSGYLPVYVTSSSSALLYFFDFTLQITGASVTFDTATPGSDPTFSDSRYVFYGNSQDEYFGSTLGYAYSPTDFSAYDTADNSTPGPIGPTSRLLGLVPVTADESLLGDVTVTLSSAQFLLWDEFMSSPSYTSTPGSVSVVPEPSAMALLAIGFLGLLAWQRRRTAARL